MICLWAGLVPLQGQAQQYQVYENPLPIASVNRDLLFNESVYGQALLTRLSERQQLLVAENDTLQADLEQEEQELTDLRKQSSPEEFAPLALAFDEKVKRIRQEQGTKSTQLADDLEAARVSFFRSTEDVIRDLMEERGIVYVLNEQAVLLSTGEGDITAAALERLERLFADGILKIAEP
ncbi:MAG: OmpH family outer membrane protein [Rhodobacteraceae bacterium]|nr:OmpH family outer membrane protein [Paracoccaceae bacterium]